MLVVPFLCAVMTTINVCMNEYVSVEARCALLNVSLLRLVFCCLLLGGPDCAAQLPTARIKISCLIWSTESQRFSVICPVVVTVVTLHKLDIWVKGHKLLSLLSV